MKSLSFLMIFIFLASLAMISGKSTTTVKTDDSFIFTALTSHSPISITSDGTGFSSISGVTGAGTSGNPWIIEGFSIDASGTTEGGIYISGTTDYFIIRNCYVSGGPNSGIYISNVADYTFLIKNNTLESNDQHGIFLDQAAYGNITDNICDGNGDKGIVLNSNVEYNKIFNNTFQDNGGHGISVAAGEHLTIFNNTIDNNGGYGIYLDSDYNTIGNNTCSNNGDDGIHLSSANHCHIENNTLSNNDAFGIHISSSLDIHFSDNTLVNDGFFVTTALHYFEQIYFNDDTVNGLPVGYFVSNESIAISSSYGQLILANCSGINIVDQDISNVENGIYMTYCTGVYVQDSEFSNCEYNAIYGDMSNDSVILKNQISDSEVGIRMFNRNSSFYATYANHLISSNILDNVDYGIWVESCLEATIYNNTITSYGDYGIRVYTSSTNALESYIITYNVINVPYGYGIYVVEANWFTKATHSLLIHHNKVLSSNVAVYITGVLMGEIYENTFTNFVNYGVDINCDDYPAETALQIHDNFLDNGNQFGIALYKVSNATINNNTIENISGDALKLDNCGRNITIELNTIDNCTSHGIEAIVSTDLVIQENTISDVDSGILFSGENCTIYNNTLTDVGYAGIDISNDDNNVTILKNSISQIYDCGIFISNNCDQITIANNTISQFTNPSYGRGIQTFGSSNVNILHNSIVGAYVAGIDIDGNNQAAKFSHYYIFDNYIAYCKVGMILQDGIYNATIKDNAIRYSDVNGLSLLEVSYIDITENKVVTSGDYGITVDGTHHVNITYNLVQDSVNYGICVFDDSSYVTVHHNSLYGNNPDGDSQAKDDGTNNIWYDDTVDEGNYWDDWSGSGTYAIDGTASSEDLYPLGAALEPPLVSEMQPVLIPIMIFSVLSVTFVVFRKRKNS